MSTREIEKMVLRKSKHNRRGGMTEPYPYASRNIAEKECIKFCREDQREEQSNNL